MSGQEALREQRYDEPDAMTGHRHTVGTIPEPLAPILTASDAQA